MAPDGERASSSSSSTRTPPIYSLATTKAVKPGNKTVVPKPSLRINLQQQQRQRQQQQLRAIRRKRTVAFAVNHERVSQPTAACVVSTDAAPDCGNSSNARCESTRVTVDSKNSINDCLNSTLNRNPTRASPAIRDSSCTFQHQDASGFGEDYHVKDDDTNQREQEGSNAENGRQNLSIDDKKALHCTDYIHANKKPKHNNRLVVDVRCAEEAAAAISNDTAQITSSCDGCHSAPVPVTPTFLSPCVNDTHCATAKNGSKRQPSKKQRSCPDQEKEEGVTSLPISSSSELPVKISQKPKTKRVRYDMECVPAVDINQDLWRDISIYYRKQSPSTDSCLPGQRQRHDNEKNLVPSDLLRGSVLWIPSSRQEWEDCLSEMKAVCTSAAFRRWSKSIIKEYENNVNKTNHNSINSSQAKNTSQALGSSQRSSATMTSFHPPLSQYFIKDRVRIDDPLRGYQIRHAEGGWLQGFLVWTNFTVWTLDFRWDSNHPTCGLVHHDTKPEGSFVADDDGTLSSELQALPRGEQDPLDGGIVLKQVAEISLLGGLGCGELLLRKTIEDIRKSKNSDNCKYKYVVLQATKGSRRFYEKMGFVRVGAVCRYRWARYCTNKNGFDKGKKVDTNKAQPMDVDPKFHGYRHWTYTNESSKSLNAHGGPSVMMCLKLDDYGSDKDQHDNGRTVSELLEKHAVDQKPMIQLFGNVANPDNENVAPTRKSQRRSSGCGSFRGQHHEQKDDSSSQRQSFIGEPEVGEFGTATAARRTSNRSKRGQNTSLANSGYVLYGIEGGQNVDNAATNSKNTTKRKRRSSKTQRNVSSQEKRRSKEHSNQAVVAPLALNILESTMANDGKSSATIQLKGYVVPASVMSTKTDKEKIPHEVLPLPCGKECHRNEILKECDEKSIENQSFILAPRQDHKSSQKIKNSLPIANNPSPERTASAMIPETEKAASTSTGTKETGVLERVAENLINIEIGREGQGDTIEQKQCLVTGMSSITSQTNENKDAVNLRLNNQTVSLSLSKDREIKYGVKASEPLEEAITKKLTSASSTIQKAAKLHKERVLVNDSVTSSSNPPALLPRKRLRQAAKRVVASTLLKQKVSKQTASDPDYYNRVVIRRNVQDYIDRGCDSRSSKRRRGNDNSKKGNVRWRYNGGLMIDHRYEFCYYFVLDYNETKKKMTIVPMIKDGVFEKTIESKNKTTSPSFDEKLLGRPRYQCNILETDKNWIRDVSLDAYVVVPEAMAVFDTPLVAQEAWDIGGNAFGVSYK